MVKILILNPNISTLGGGEKHMLYYCHFFELYYNKDVAIEILVYNNGFKKKDYISVEELCKVYNIDLECVTIRYENLNATRDSYLQAYRLKKTIENISKKYDIFINFMIDSRFCGKAKKNIYSVMFPPKPYLSSYPSSNWLLKWGYGIMDRKYKKSYDVFISNSHYTEYWLYRYWRGDINSLVIYPPVFTEEKTKNRYVEEKKERIILSVGRFFVGGHNKHQYEMVKAFIDNEHQFDGYEYYVVGNVNEEKEDIEYFEGVLSLSHSSTKVHVMRNVSYEELVGLYERASIFWHATGYGENDELHPEKLEHFGITTVEAMSYGVIPVVINKGGQREIIDNEINGFLWNEIDECVKKTSMVISMLDSKRADQCIENAIKKSKKYSVNAFCKECEQLMDIIKC